MTQVLQFSLGPLSRLLANTGVSIYKFVKFKLLESVEAGIPIVGCIPFNSTVVYDGTFVIQQLPEVSQPLVSGTCQQNSKMPIKRGNFRQNSVLKCPLKKGKQIIEQAPDKHE